MGGAASAPLRQLERFVRVGRRRATWFMKRSNRDKRLGWALPLQSATSRSTRTNHPCENETGLDVSQDTRISPRGGEKSFS